MDGLYLTAFGAVLLVAAWGLHKLNTRWFTRKQAEAKEKGMAEPSPGLYLAIDRTLLLIGRGLGLLFVVMGMWLFTGSFS